MPACRHRNQPTLPLCPPTGSPLAPTGILVPFVPRISSPLEVYVDAPGECLPLPV